MDGLCLHNLQNDNGAVLENRQGLKKQVSFEKNVGGGENIFPVDFCVKV